MFKATSPDKLPLDQITIQPKKSEITVSGVTLVWMPVSSGN